MTNRVTCINKTDRYNPWERIDRLGGTKDSDGSRWGCTQQECVAYIEKGYEFYVDTNGHREYLVVGKSSQGNKYVKTEADQDTQDNLLSLPECPRS
ncbi:DUF3892 domain-containing protein [Pikeienuella piscinae]|uniref:DUF3892 domain-containing protein n=1 Tax=Pikeienuella piscinae TaxID=2748098 RepID=A0A7L5BUN4_9RHOB|nr:DUF3892 domain-containing protein [Pikeienuella piscinae]